MANDANRNLLHNGNGNGNESVPPTVNACAMRDADPPTLPRPRMPRTQRAKIFIPFDPLKGYREALHEKELEAEASHRERISIEDAP